MTIEKQIVVTETYDKGEIVSTLIQRVSAEGADPVQTGWLAVVRPFRDGPSGREYAPADKSIHLQIDDIRKVLPTAPEEIARARVLEAETAQVAAIDEMLGA